MCEMLGFAASQANRILCYSRQPFSQLIKRRPLREQPCAGRGYRHAAAIVRRHLALEMVCGADSSWKLMCGAGPGGLRGSLGSDSIGRIVFIYKCFQVPTNTNTNASPTEPVPRGRVSNGAGGCLTAAPPYWRRAGPFPILPVPGICSAGGCLTARTADKYWGWGV